jgi:hypothetical protein
MKYVKPEVAVLDAACTAICSGSVTKGIHNHEIDFAPTVPAYEADE